ncbi:MAG: CCA tRNA nucleotidyltransferase [Desulfamplus sp.]|nr:CCA tRNA nucleotidyltransferase [Desulfamplus sp.]
MELARAVKISISDSQNISLDIVKRLAKEGFKAFFVGGVVRDMVMVGQDHKPSDFDILTNAPTDEIIRIFSGERVKKVGKAFAICMVNGIEVASCRSDSDMDNFPECDLACRDITINSMAFDPLSGMLIDPFDGRKDITDKIIRFTGSPDDRILEDPLRMVRACRFASLINGNIDDLALDSIIRYRHLTTTYSSNKNSNTDNKNITIYNTNINGYVSPERIRYEILKAMSHKKPSLFFKALHSAGVLELIFPSLARCDNLDGGPHHGESVLEHCLLTGDALSARNPILRLAGYLHDAGKYDAAQIKDGQITFPEHEKMVDAVIYDLKNLRFSIEEIKFIEAVIRTHMRPLTPDSTPKAVRRLLAFLKEHDVKWQTFMQMRIADKAANLAKHPYNRSDIRLRVGKIWSELTNGQLKGGKLPLSIKDLAISGHDVMEILNITPGPEVGRVMNYLFECVIDEPSLNNFEALRELVIQYLNIACNSLKPQLAAIKATI